MTNSTEIIIFLVVIVAVVASRMISSSATQKLNDEMKLKIFNGFSKRNNYLMVVILAVIFAFFISTKYLPEYNSILTLAYIGILAAYFIIKLFLNFRKLKEIGAPADYVRSIALSWAAFIIGFGVIAVIVVVQMTGSANQPL